MDVGVVRCRPIGIDGRGKEGGREIDGGEGGLVEAGGKRKTTMAVEGKA